MHACVHGETSPPPSLHTPHADEEGRNPVDRRGGDAEGVGWKFEAGATSQNLATGNGNVAIVAGVVDVTRRDATRRGFHPSSLRLGFRGREGGGWVLVCTVRAWLDVEGEGFSGNGGCLFTADGRRRGDWNCLFSFMGAKREANSSHLIGLYCTPVTLPLRRAFTTSHRLRLLPPPADDEKHFLNPYKASPTLSRQSQRTTIFPPARAPDLFLPMAQKSPGATPCKKHTKRRRRQCQPPILTE